MTHKNLLRILFVEDLPSDVELAVLELRKEGLLFKHIRVDTRDEFLEALKEFKPEIIISDYLMPTYNGMQALKDAREFDPLLPFVIFTGSMNEETAVECLKAGATDYVIKEHMTRLPFAVKEALEQHRIQIEKRVAELLLKENEEKLQSIFSAAPVGIGLIVNRVFIEVNDTFCKMTGYDRKELIGKKTEMIYATSEEFERGETEKYRQITEKGTGSVETRFKHKDGRYLDVIFSSEPLDQADQAKGETFIAMDITGKKQAETALRVSEEKYRRLFENVHDLFYETSLDGTIIEVSPSIKSLSKGQYNRDELIGKPMNDFYADPKQRIALLDILREHGFVSDYEITLKNRDGSKIPCSISAKIIFDSVGRPERINGTMRDISDRKLAEENLKNSEERFKILFEYAPDAYYLNDLKGNLIDGNIAAEKLLGIERKELIGKSFLNLKLLSADQILKAAALLLKNVLWQSTGPDEFILHRKDGSKVNVEILTHPVKILGRTLVLGLARDITERKKAEDAIDNERRLLRTLIDNLPDHIYVKDADCRKIISNKADVSGFGLDEEAKVLGKTDIELIPGPIGERGYNDDKKVINTGKAILDHEEDFVNKKGVRRWSLTSKIPLHDKDGNITRLVGVGHDITRRKEADEALRQSYTFIDSLLKTIPFGMHIVDQEGNVLFRSESFKKLFGDVINSEKCWELLKDDHKKCRNCPLADEIAVGETNTYEADGVLGGRTFEISHTGMMYSGKKAMLEIFVDITERKEKEEELTRAKEKAEESDRLKTAFLHNISHEIRTPMNAIVGFSALLGETGIDKKTQDEYIENITHSSDHLLSIISDILEISNIEANIIRITKQEVRLNSIFSAMYEQFRPKAQEKRLTLIVKTGLPDENSFIYSDPTRITQVISNLLTNAIKFTSEGEVTFGYNVKDKMIGFFVSDTGIGIPEEYHERIFDRFFQVEDPFTKFYEGTGLGLALSKAYVEMLGGEIRVSSVPGQGSTFSFTIPYDKPVKAIEQKEVVKEPHFAFTRPMKILVAEDVDSNFQLIHFFLSGINAHVIRASNGKEAVDIVRREDNFDLILMDIKMPEMDGYTASKIIHESRPEIPIIAQTAYIDDKSRAIEAGCSGFITKPFDKKKLLDAIQEVITKS